jgi:hypothetical protein
MFNIMSTKKPKTLKSKIINFWQKYESKIVLAIGLILVATLAFEAGALKGQKWQQEPLIIEKPLLAGNQLNQPVPSISPENAPEAQNSPLETAKTSKVQSITEPSSQDCAFVGSKNSTKYHLPTCQFAKRIKPENTVCFKSEEEAKGRGYTPCGTCMK